MKYRNGEPIFLSEQGIRDLTARVRPSAQARWLISRGWVFAIKADGRLVVSLAEVNRQLSGLKPSSKAVEPSMEAIDAMG
jgi:hypothetical protein